MMPTEGSEDSGWHIKYEWEFLLSVCWETMRKRSEEVTYTSKNNTSADCLNSNLIDGNVIVVLMSWAETVWLVESAVKDPGSKNLRTTLLSVLKRLGFSVLELQIFFSTGKFYYRSADRTYFTLLYFSVQSYLVSQFCFRGLFRKLFWKCRFIRLPALDMRTHPFTQPILAFFFFPKSASLLAACWLMHWWKWQH